MGTIGKKAIQGLAAGIGLVSEGIHAHKAHKQQRQQQQTQTRSRESVQIDRSLPEDNGYYPSEHHDGRTQSPDRAVVETLEEQWELDEAQEELLAQSQHPEDELDEKNAACEPLDEAGLAREFVSEHPPPYTLSPDAPAPQLMAPVVLPQRRPKDRTRGFIRAYAPCLADFDIDEKTFIDFLDTAEKACLARKWLNAINLASLATMCLPSVTGMAVSIAIQIATDIAIAADGRQRTNTFFAKMNKEFFIPRGLFCLVMTWNPELVDAPSMTVDVNSIISQTTNASNAGTLARLRNRFKSSDGKGYGNIFPEVAPLVFPDLDKLVTDQDAEKKLSKMKKTKAFVEKYKDKRAQAKFIAENPNSQLNQGPKPTFTSRYADPNHPASSGDLLALVTGGHVSSSRGGGLLGGGLRGSLGGGGGGGRNGYQDQDAYYSNGQNGSYGRSIGGRERLPGGRGGLLGGGGLLGVAIDVGRQLSQRQSSTGASAPNGVGRNDPSPGFNSRQAGLGLSRGDQKGIGLLRKVYQKKVLYLAIVNMPSEAELNQARRELGQ
ncbi:hypothetical protein MPDQ_000598 [Monascus purpureus]|uniref:Uncharacterized protein n=1 Tax=Monascus purpureus TaxID=5098 RepID=A0A507QTL4_MONPU|nr:hypothetical protein MPDQ_000598 [Monascus purpureus]BDD63681.1 hypothetical protein MAP00_008549 [Monascus purpureus]